MSDERAIRWLKLREAGCQRPGQHAIDGCTCAGIPTPEDAPSERNPKQCPVIRKNGGWRCQLPLGHSGPHEADSPPVAAQPTERPEVEREQWRPMESAPMDGTAVLLWKGAEAYTARWIRSEVMGPVWATPDGYVIFRASHWMPLPGAPTAAVPRDSEERKPETTKLMDGMELAWGIIANASGGNWENESPEWQEAAHRWRDEHWHPALDRYGYPPRDAQPEPHP